MMGINNIEQLSSKLQTKQEFELFLQTLLADYLRSPCWENNTLERFLEALSAYCIDVQETQPSWKLFAEMLLASRIYE